MSPVQVVKDWWFRSTLKSITMLGTAVTTVLTTILVVAHFAGAGEPYWFATRGFTRELVQAVSSALSNRLLAVEIGQKESQREEAQREINRLEIEIEKNKGGSESLRQLLNEQLQRQRDQFRLLDIEVNNLRHLRNGGPR